MREILFRGKRVDNDKWVEGDLHKNIDFSKAHIHPVGEKVRSYDVIPETVGQFTGLTDRNGKKIFESDICSYVDFLCDSDTEQYREGEWFFEDGQFYITDRISCDTSDLISDNKFDGYVIGNIHDKEEK